MTTSTTTLRVDFVSESAAYDNVFGWYDKTTGMGGILFADVEQEGRNAPLVAGQSYATFTVNTADVANIQFFLIPNGYNINKEDPGDLTGAIKVIQLSDGSWAVADVDANGNVITKHGKPDILNGAGANALFTETSKNAGGTDYASSVVGSNQTATTLAGDTADGATGLIAWEDLAATRNKHGVYGKPGDADYNDAVFRVSIVGGAPVANADAVSVSEDADATTINVLANDSDPDAGDTLHVTAINTAGVLGTVTIAPGGGNIVYTPAASFQSLGAGQTATETFSYTVADQAGHTTSANVTVTIVGANDGPVAVNDSNAADPVVESGVNPGNTAFVGDVTATGNVLTNDTDVDAGDTKTVTTTGIFAGTYGSVTLAADGSYTYTLDNALAATNSLAQGEVQSDVFSYTMRDAVGATSTATLTINVAGTNDAPVITGGATTGSVKEDTANQTQATGQLFATDPDHNATKAWTVVGGTQSTAADYHFRADSFTITRFGNPLLQDEFDDGLPPPNSPNFIGNPNPTTYTGFGGFTESGGKLLLDSNIAQNPFNANPQDPVIGQNALARTNIDPANTTAGLKTNTPFTVEGVFDLILPDSPRESYGIRVIDRLINNPPQPTDQPGNDTIELVVRMNLAGVVTVALRRIDFGTGTVTQIESIPLNTALGADQIHLKFDHVANAAAISASFDYMQGGAVIASQAFTSTPEIFHGENWTRGDFVASAPLMTDSILEGTYGTLNINQSGTWNYLLNNADADTNALAQGEQATETFQVKVTDQFSASDTRTVTIGVAGKNDAPTVSAAVTGGGSEGSGTASVNLLQFASDVDHGAVLHVDNVVWDEVPGNMPAGFTVVGNSIEVDTNSLAYNAMAQGEVFSTHFTYNVVDEFGAIKVQHATVTITGTNDAPTVSAAVSGGGGEGSGTASVDLLQFASDVDNGAVLHVEGVTWDEVPGNMPAGFTLVGNSIEVDTNSLAYNAMAQGETFATHFTYNVVDEFGAITVQHATVTVTGTNDAPTVSAEATGGGNEGSGTATVNLLQGASGVDNGAVLHVENVVWNEVPAGMPAGFTVVGNSIEIDTNSLAYNAMAEGEVFSTHFTYDVVDEYGASTVQHATVTVTGTNDAPTVSAAVSGGGNEGSGGASVDLLQFVSDVDNGAVLHIDNVVWDESPGNLPAGFVLVGNSIEIDTNSGAYDALAQGETFTTHFTYDVVDEHGASTVQHAEVTITGTNDAPVITGGATTGAIQEDTGPAFVTGTLTAADPDHGATQTWSVVGGTTPHAADYHVMVDEFRVTKNGNPYFLDTFSDGNPPPSITGVPDPSVFYSIRPGNLVTEADGYAVLDGINSLPPAFGTGANHNVKLFTNFDNSNTTLGLKKGDSFTVEGRFDLVPLDQGDSYGIRLDDRVLPTGPSAPPQHPGDDGIQLMVTRSSLTGNVIVRLGEVDFIASTNTTLAATLLNAAGGDDQIVLKLTHDASNPGVLTASYQLYDDGVATGSGTLSSVAARIFGTETPGDTSDDENWTQAVFESGDNLTNSQSQNGAYGSLSLNQNGTWTYNLANTHANVQALAQGEIVHDTFQVQVTDQFGAFDTETVDVTVTGTNDAPVIAEGVTAGAVEEDNNPLATGHLDATDVDHNAAITWSVVGGTQVNSDAIFALDEFKVIKNGVTLFDDTFSNGIAPPNAPNLNIGLPNETTTSYATPAGAAFIETLDHVIMYGPLGPAPVPGIGPGAPNFVSYGATLQTNIDSSIADNGVGLRKGSTFSVEGRFEGLVPEDNREGYGIRLTDRNTPASPTTQNPFNPGNDVLELSVRRDINGNLAVQFRDLDIENNATPVTLGSVALTPTMLDGNLVILQLNHATIGSNNITATYSIVDHDGNVVVPATVIQNLTNTGPAIGQAFTNENYTRAQFIGSEPVENISYLHGQYGSLTIDQQGNWKYLLDNNSASVQALAEGETVVDTFQVRATDEHGAFDTKTVTVTVTGDNDAPKITSAVTVGSVQEDGTLQTTGTLTATDVDHGAIKTWNVVGGNTGHVTDYRVTIDEFKIVKNGVTIFDDTFTGTFPPTGPAGQPPYIGTNNQFTGSVDGRAVMDDEHSGIGFSISNPALDFTGQPTGGIGNWAQIGTNKDPNDLTQGLKSGSSFSISGTYDLIHSEAGYGVRLANTDGSINFAGNDVVDFNVRTGGPFGPSALYLQLTQIDFTVPNGATTLQQLLLSPPAGADQILLTLTHDAATNGVVKASFSYLDDGVVVGGGSTLSAEGHIFQNTNWVRGGFEATAPGNTSSFVNGIYGALAVNQNGNWTYNLANNQTNVQALAQGQTVTDTFTVKVTDEHGASDMRTINVTVTGTNDLPIVTAAVSGGGAEGSGLTAVDLMQFASDIDNGASLHIENLVWDEVPGGMPAGFTVVGTAIQIDTNSPAYDGLALGQTFTANFTYNVVDQFGASVVQHASLTITGANDAPVVTAAVTGGGAEGTGTATVDLLQFASDADNGESLHIENVVWDEVPGDMPAGFTLVGNTIEVDTNALAYDAMAQGESFVTHFTYNVVDQFGASTVQHATVTITGTNDAPAVSAAVTGGGTEDTGAQSVDLLQFASDVDHNAALHIENVVWDEVPGNMPAGFTVVGNSIQVDTNSPAYDGLNTGQTYVTHFTYNVVDEHGASTVQHATVTINGVTDVVVTPNQAPVIHVVSGTGFAPAANFASGLAPGYAAIGDLNGDGKADLVVSNFQGGTTTVSTLLGDGAGNFGAPTAFNTGGTAPSSVVLADFNGDGKLDLATTNQDSANVAVMFGNGAGGFGAATLLFAQNPTSVTTGDFNEDGIADLLVGQSIGNRVSLFLGNQNGTFGAPTTPFTGLQVGQTAVGDFNHDGNLDFVAAVNSGSSSRGATVVLGNGNGTFALPTQYLGNAAATAASIAVGDFNGDGNLDIAQADTGGPGGVSIMLGNFNGTFGARTNYGTIAPANSTHDLVVADFNGDGKLDLALGNTAANSATLMYGNGDGSFQPEVSFSTGAVPTTITVGDVNGDGRPDLVTPNRDANTVSVLTNLAGTPVNEEGLLTLTNISVTDPDANPSSDAMSVSISASHGVLSLATTGGLSGDFDGSDGILSFTGSLNAINAALQSGLSYGAALNYTGGDDLNIVVNDQGHNGTGGPLSDSETIHITVTPVNDAPTIAGVGPATGSVTEDNTRFLTARGNLFANDVDGDQTTWSIVGGTTSAETQDFRFQVDNLKITKAGATIFEDTFNDGNPPPSAPSISYTNSGTFTEAAGRAFFDGTQSVVFGTTNYGERLMVNTNTNPLPDNTGLKRNTDFTAEARFDLIMPEDVGDAYGIRLVDQPAPPGTNNSIVDLVVLRDGTGVHVALRQISVSPQSNVTLQQIDLPPGSFGQIVLKLDYKAISDQGTTLGGKVTASFDLLNNGVPAVPTTTFTPQGTIFVGEDFTRVQLVGQANQAETGVYKMAGTYGTLTMAQDGQWHYFLADQQANVQALNDGDQVFDNFTVRVSDGHGGFADKQVSIAVNGAADGNASIGNPNVASVTEDLNVTSGNLTASGTIPITDPDAGQAAFQTGVTPAGGNLGGLTLQSNGNYTYSVANSAVQFLGQNATKVDSFTVRSVDGTQKVVNFTINGVNDAPVAQDDSNSQIVEQGASVFSNSFTSGQVLLNDSDVDNGDVLSVSGLAAGATNTPLFGGINFAIAGTYGSLMIGPGGGWTYNLDNNNPLTNALADGQVAQDVFTYTVIDGKGGTDNATITINVNGTNDAPTASLPKHEMLEDSGTHQIDLLAGSSDPEGDSFHLASINSPWSWLTLNPDGHTISIDTNDSWFDNMSMGQTVDYTFGYTLEDSHGASMLQFANFRMVGIDDAPGTGVDGNWTVHAAGGLDPGHPEATMRIFVADPDWIGLGPNNEPIQQPVYADTTGWTANGGGIFSKGGTYGTLVWNTNLVTTPDGQHYATLTYQLDNDDIDTLNLDSSDNVYDSFAVTYTDGTLSTTRIANYEVVGRDDMYGQTLHWQVRYPTTDIPAPPNADVTFVVGPQVEMTGWADADVNLTRDQIIIDWHDPASYPLGGNYRWADGSIHDGPPPEGSYTVYSGLPFNGFMLEGLPDLQNISLHIGSPNVPPMWWDEDNTMWVNNQGLSYPAGGQQIWDLTFTGGTALGDPSSNPNPAPVDVPANTQSIGPIITVHDSFIFDLNVPYSGNVQFEGANGTLKFEATAFTGTVSNFQDGDHLDFSAITNGNATVHEELDGMLEAHSIGWTTDGTDTFVFVNNTGVDEAIAAANMMVKLLNVTQLHSHDVIV